MWGAARQPGRVRYPLANCHMEVRREAPPPSMAPNSSGGHCHAVKQCHLLQLQSKAPIRATLLDCHINRGRRTSAFLWSVSHCISCTVQNTYPLHVQHPRLFPGVTWCRCLCSRVDRLSWIPRNFTSHCKSLHLSVIKAWYVLLHCLWHRLHVEGSPILRPGYKACPQLCIGNTGNLPNVLSLQRGVHSW